MFPCQITSIKDQLRYIASIGGFSVWYFVRSLLCSLLLFFFFVFRLILLSSFSIACGKNVDECVNGISQRIESTTMEKKLFVEWRQNKFANKMRKKAIWSVYWRHVDVDLFDDTRNRFEFDVSDLTMAKAAQKFTYHIIEIRHFSSFNFG